MTSAGTDAERQLLPPAALSPASLRSFDAIHLATALSPGQDLAGVVTYDQRLSDAAVGADLEVCAPA
jgi:predicted nucleic acid-binding protein